LLNYKNIFFFFFFNFKIQILLTLGLCCVGWPTSCSTLAVPLFPVTWMHVTSPGKLEWGWMKLTDLCVCWYFEEIKIILCNFLLVLILLCCFVFNNIQTTHLIVTQVMSFVNTMYGLCIFWPLWVVLRRYPNSVFTLIITRYAILSGFVLHLLFYYAFKVMYTEL
jgi:hypothetical protein